MSYFLFHAWAYTDWFYMDTLHENTFLSRSLIVCCPFDVLQVIAWDSIFNIRKVVVGF